MMRDLFLPCKTTCACDINSSGTYGTGTIGLDPMMTPPVGGLLPLRDEDEEEDDPPPAPPPPPPPPPEPPADILAVDLCLDEEPPDEVRADLLDLKLYK